MRTALSLSASLVLPLVTLPLTAGAQSWTAPRAEDVSAILAQRLGPTIPSGIVVAYIDPHASGSKRTQVVGYGRTRPGGPPVGAHTVFEIGSVTKVFTTTVLADMVRTGEVKLDDPVQKYLPAGVHIPMRGDRQITLLDLASQTSGLPRMPSNFAPKDPTNPYADYTVQQMYDFLSSYTLPRDPGKQYEYSNLGMGLLGHALALRAGLSYEALVTKRILEPLGMHDTRIVLTPAMTARLAQGHNEGGQPVANWDLPTFAGAGAIRSTADDMLKFLAAALDTTTGPLAKDFALAEVPRRPVTDNGQLRIGLGWHVLTGPGGEIVWHNGQTGGYHAFIAVNHATGANVVVLSASAADIDDIGMHLIDARLPLRQPKKAHVEVAIDPSMLDQYVGVYEFAPTFSITVTKDGTSLWAQATGQGKLQLFPESPTDFFLKALEASVSFVKDSSGAVTTMVLHQGGTDQNGKRIR